MPQWLVLTSRPGGTSKVHGTERPFRPGGVEACAAPQKAAFAAERQRQAAAEQQRQGGAGQPKEAQGRGGLDPTRYGDWEIKGVASDF